MSAKIIKLPILRKPALPPGSPPFTEETLSRELWRIMYELRNANEERLLARRDAAEIEWGQRLELHEQEHGAGSSTTLAAQYEAYVAGREDELKIRGDDIGIARALYEAIGVAGARDTSAIRDALRGLTAREMLRLERRM